MTTEDEDKFRICDTVRVKNIPGPRMMITGFKPGAKAGEPNVCCKWFTKNMMLETEWFHTRMLIRVSPWTERPGYRVALETIRDTWTFEQPVTGNSSIKVVTPAGVPVSLIDFIDEVLAHTHERALPPTASDHLAQAEMVDAAD